jgi:hypothetical protein
MYASNVAATEHFFVFNIGAAKAPDPENPAGQRYYISATQFIEVLPLPQGKTATLLDHVAFITTDVEGLRNYFVAYNAAPGELQTGKDGSRWFKVNDPEGNIIEFVQYSGQQPLLPVHNPVGSHFLNVGFVVNSYESEDYFFKGLFGFRYGLDGIHAIYRSSWNPTPSAGTGRVQPCVNRNRGYGGHSSNSKERPPTWRRIEWPKDWP